MGVTVWVLTVEDGNVCCPGMDLLGVFSTKADGEAAADLHAAQRNVVRSDYSVTEWTLGELRP